MYIERKCKCMWITDIFKVLFSLMDSENGDHEMAFHLIEKIENNIIYFTNGEKLAFRDVDTDTYEMCNLVAIKDKLKGIWENEKNDK